MESNDLRRLHAIEAIVGRPAWLKTASATDGTAKPTSGFADPIAERFPCHTKTACYQSCLLALDETLDVSTEARLNEFAHLWGIEGDVKMASEKMAAARREVSVDELPDGDFALVADYNGQKVRKYAAFDGATTVDAAIAFHENRAKYPYAWRKQAAVNLIARAARHGVVLPAYVDEYLHKAAAFGVPTEDSIDQLAVSRVQRGERVAPEATAKLAEVLEDFATSPELRYDRDHVLAVLEVVDAFDRQTKIAAYYEHGLDLPEEMVAHTEPELAKIAGASADIVRLVNGRDVLVSQLPKDVLSAVDENLAGMPTAKLAQVLPTLPKPDADLLVRLMPKTAAAE